MKYNYLFKAVAVFIILISVMIFAIQLNKIMFPVTSIWSWEFYKKKGHITKKPCPFNSRKMSDEEIYRIEKLNDSLRVIYYKHLNHDQN